MLLVALYSPLAVFHLTLSARQAGCMCVVCYVDEMYVELIWDG